MGKRFGALQALREVDIAFRPGQIHAVLGENGAGKSTLMNILAGFLVPDSGSVRLDGDPVPPGRPFESKRRGIEMIHQHFMLVPELTVAENLALVRLPGLARSVDLEASSARARELAAAYGWDLDPTARVRNLPVGVQQRLEILKALSGDARVLIFDEPTAVLAPDEVEDLLGVMRRLRNEGRVVVLIAHKLSEVLAVADEITVLRRGEKVGHGPRSSFDEDSLARLMVGEMPLAPANSSATGAEIGLTVADAVVKGDRGETSVRGAGFQAHLGEILGIGGVDGNGQIELAEAIVGVRPLESGQIAWRGKPLDDTVQIGYVPQDRQVDGLALGMSISDNLFISGVRRPEFFSGPLLSFRRLNLWAKGLIERFSIKAPGPGTLVGSLSGGNQQKVVVARTMDASPELLVVLNPTRGLDVRAADFVHRSLAEARDRGAAVILFSTDLDELMAVADRVLFMSRGALSAEQGARAVVGS